MVLKFHCIWLFIDLWPTKLKAPTVVVSNVYFFPNHALKRRISDLQPVQSIKLRLSFHADNFEHRCAADLMTET